MKIAAPANPADDIDLDPYSSLNLIVATTCSSEGHGWIGSTTEMIKASSTEFKRLLTYSSKRKYVQIVVASAISLIVIAVSWWYISLPWEWSDIDDPGFVLSLENETAKHGIFGYLTHVWHMVQVDLNWGLFRPSYWLYPSVVYGFPIGIAHLIRLALLLLALIGPIIAFRRRGANTTTLVMGLCMIIISGRHLFDGLFLVSIQELSGAAFVGLGLMLRTGTSRLASWTIAAWFKSPFSWLLIGESVVLWREGQRRQALLAGGLGIGTLSFSYVFASSGSYTTRYTLDYGAAWRAWTNVPKLLELGTAFMLVALVWWLITTSTQLRMDRMSAVLAVGWLGYTAQLLPWAVTGYYAGALNYLLPIFLFSLLTSNGSMVAWRRLVALGLPLLLAALTLTWIVRDLYAQNMTARGVTDCIVSIGPAPVSISSSFGPEAVVRIEQKLQIATGQSIWLVESFDPASDTRPGTIYVLAPEESVPSNLEIDGRCHLNRAVVGTAASN